MPVEVRELVIKAMITPETAESNNTSGLAGNNTVSPTEDMMKIDVEKILEILKEARER